MEEGNAVTALILPDVSAFWPGLTTPTWTPDGIRLVQQWFGTGDQIIYVGSPDFTMDELTTDESGFDHAWTHWAYQQSKNGFMPNVMVAHRSVYSSTTYLFGPKFIASHRQITVFIADKEQFADCNGNPRQLSFVWQDLLEGHFNVSRWRSDSMLMGNLRQTVTTEEHSQVVVIDEIQGKLVPTTMMISATT